MSRPWWPAFFPLFFHFVIEFAVTEVYQVVTELGGVLSCVEMVRDLWGSTEGEVN